MSVRNCAELGTNTRLIIDRLLKNQNLLKLLYYTDDNPLIQEDLSEKVIKEEIVENLVKMVPRIGDIEDAKSRIVLKYARSIPNMNDEFKDVIFEIESFVPLTQWVIKDTNLRPFAIMGEIEKSLKNKKVDGLGKIKGGNFELNFLTDEISAYTQKFSITTYD